MAVSFKQFRERLDDSGLLSQEEVQALLDGLPASRQPGDGEQLVRLLVKQKKLTSYQAQQIYAGKGKSLVLGNYVILDKLGQGGMGLVLKAEHQRMERVVALKVLSPKVTKTPEALARFLREVKAAAKLIHQNIVTAFDADEFGETHFLVMEYIDGTDLAKVVQEKGPLAVEQAVYCILQAARGLEYAHQRGVVHRDIKPANLLLDAGGTLKILDMGLARLESAGEDQDQLTGTGQIMGTVDYMAPEQALNTKNADARADIYSLGVALWYLLTGKPVYEGETVVAKMMAHQQAPVPSLQAACPEASSRLNEIFNRMVAKSPEDRYQNMSAVIADMEQAMSGSEVAPSLVATPREDSRLDAFLINLPRTGSPVVTTKTVAAKKQKAAITPALDATVALQSNQLDTNPETQDSLTPTLATDPTTRGRTRPPRWQNHVLWVAGGVGPLLLLFATIVFFIQTKDGTIRVEINDPDIEVSIKGSDIVFSQLDSGTDVKLSPGDHTLVVERGDFKFETDKLVLKKNDKVTISVELLAGEVQVRQGEKLLGQQSLPREQPRNGQSPQIVIAPSDEADAKPEILGAETRRGYALAFDGKDDYVEFPTLQFDGVHPITIEASITLLQPPQSSVNILGDSSENGSGGVLVQATSQNRLTEWSFRVTGENAVYRGGTSGGKLIVGFRQHLAIVITPEYGKCFVDGRLWASTNGGKLRPSSRSFWLGTLPNNGPCFQGMIDEFRVSKVVRYAKDFTPPDSLEADRNTVALYHFDEGQGDVLKDSSGNGHHGKIVGAKWGKVDDELNVIDTNKSELGRALSKISACTWQAGGEVWIWDQEKQTSLMLKAESDLPAEPKSGPSLKFKDMEGVKREQLIRVARACRELPTGVTFSIELSGTPVSVADVQEFAGLPVFGLTLNRNKRINDGISEIISQLRQLHTLGLQETSITDATMQAIALQTQVEELNLRHTAVTKKSIPHLISLGLAKLNVTGTVFDEQGVMELHEASPHCEITWDGGTVHPQSTTYAWPKDQPAPAIAPFTAEEAKQHQEAWAKYLDIPVEYENSIGMKFRLIPPGEFLMGSPDSDNGADLDEKPQHRVRITLPFYLAKHEVTQAQWQTVMGSNPSKFRENPEQPVESVSFDDVQLFLAKLKGIDSTGQMSLMLPSEAQWEYACRAGTTSSWYFGNKQADLSQYGWYNQSADEVTHAVGRLKPNAFGLHDTHGNVWEWCADWHAVDYYTESPLDDPTGPLTGNRRVWRGGAYGDAPANLHAGSRDASESSYRSGSVGLRLAAKIVLPGKARPDKASGIRPD